MAWADPGGAAADADDHRDDRASGVGGFRAADDDVGVIAEPMLMSGVAAPEQSAHRAGRRLAQPCLILWLGVATGLFAAHILAFRREQDAILFEATDLAESARSASFGQAKSADRWPSGYSIA